jgi:4-amino-4-deoxy-L-arabinose transferase-like glycosyltransferase
MRDKFLCTKLDINYDNQKERLFLLIIFVLFIVSNVVWISLFRNRGLLDIDEAGYLSTSLVNFNVLKNGGGINWIKSVESPSFQAPITMALSSLIYVIFGPKIFIGFVVIIFFGLVAVIGSYYLGKFFGGFRLGVLTSILVAVCPAVVSYTREYSFAITATALTTVALLALLRSNHFSNIKWSIVFGIFLGLMPLARTMTIAFMPGLILAAFVSIITQSKNRFRNLRTFILCLILSFFVAATWLIPNGKYVFQYLTSFGYGNRVAEYAGSNLSKGFFHSLISWIPTIQYISNNVYFPNLVLMFIGLILLVFIFIRIILKKGYKGLKFIICSPIFLVVLFISEGLIALTSSQNKGTGFLIPLIPGMLLISLWTLINFTKNRFWNVLIIIFIFIVVIISYIPDISLSALVAKPLYINLPFLGKTVLTDGRAYIQLYESDGGYRSGNLAIPIDEQKAKVWTNISVITASKLSLLSGDHLLAAFGFRNRLFNVNTVNLQQLIAGRNQLSLTQIEPAITGDSIIGYMQWFISGSAAKANILLTAYENNNDSFSKAVSNIYMQKAAENVGFLFVDNWSLPDGGMVTLWRR